MKKTLALLITAGALALLLLLASGGYKTLTETAVPDTVETDIPPAAEGGTPTDAPDGGETDNELTPAPDFTVTDWDGNRVSLSDFRGTPVVINIWASWCPPCRSELPGFQTAWETYGDRVQFLMIDLTDNGRETEETCRAFLAENPYTFPVYLDTELSAATAYGASSIPMTILVDRDGNIFAGQVGAVTEDALLSAIESLLK